MELQELISNLIVDTKGLGERLWEFDPTSSVAAFRSEIVLCITMVVMLLLRLFEPLNKLDRVFARTIPGGMAAFTAFAGVFVALALSAPLTSLMGGHVERMEIFTGMLVFDSFTIYIRSILLLFALLFIVFTSITGLPDRHNSADIFTLVLGATLGMCLMASANHLMMVFMAVEMASVPSYVLAGMMKGSRNASEAALKYAVYGAGAAGVLLYGISLVAGVANSAHLPTVAIQLSERLGEMPATEQMAIVLGSLMIMAGLAFKLSAFPFHFWAPDVFEGATAEVGAFLSVASKAGALALLVRVTLGFSTPAPEDMQPGGATLQAAAVSAEPGESAMFNLEDEPASKSVEEQPGAENGAENGAADDQSTDESQTVIEGLAPSRAFMGRLIALFAALSCTFGNLAAYGQTNIKRLLSYSTIAHAGYMMMAVPPMIALIGVDSAAAEAAVGGLAIYIAIYLFMNLGAFAVVAFLRNQMNSEEIADYAGLIKRCPGVVVCFALILFSLVGLPPLAGFIGKFAIFASLAQGFRLTSQTYLLALLIVGGMNTAISLFYYLRVVKVMTMDPEPETRTPFAINWPQRVFVFALTVPVVILMVGWEPLVAMANAASQNLM